jgi:hypothetical protein
MLILFYLSDDSSIVDIYVKKLFLTIEMCLRCVFACLLHTEGAVAGFLQKKDL